jgi:serine/threonine protein kinase
VRSTGKAPVPAVLNRRGSLDDEKALKDATENEENARKEFDTAGYHLDQLLGQGKYGNVYKATKATDPSGNVFAIKVPNSDGISEIENEKEILTV